MDIAVVISTFERPWHLRRCLASLESQRGVDGRFEVVVTDDGSSDDTLRLVTDLARTATFPLTFTTHAHAGFRLARCRNEGVAASTAPYILFTDGDCILPRNHLQIHLEERRPGWVVGGDCMRLDQSTSEWITPDVVRRADVTALVPRGEVRRIRSKALRARVYQLLRMPMRPRLSGNNIALWRADYERINGFDERFVGWGLEDRDLQQRLERLGIRVRSILHRTAPVHLWHAPAPSFTRNSLGTPNLDYFRSVDARPTFCIDGLVKPEDTPTRIVTLPVSPAPMRRVAA